MFLFVFCHFSFQHAAELIKTVASRYDEYVNVKDFSDKINRALTAAKKDNDFIYHDRVPDLKDLDPIGKATLVKSTPVNVPISQKFTGMFDTHVHINLTHLFSSLICILICIFQLKLTQLLQCFDIICIHIV